MFFTVCMVLVVVLSLFNVLVSDDAHAMMAWISNTLLAVALLVGHLS